MWLSKPSIFTRWPFMTFLFSDIIALLCLSCNRLLLSLCLVWFSNGLKLLILFLTWHLLGNWVIFLVFISISLSLCIDCLGQYFRIFFFGNCHWITITKNYAYPNPYFTLTSTDFSSSCPVILLYYFAFLQNCHLGLCKGRWYFTVLENQKSFSPSCSRDPCFGFWQLLLNVVIEYYYIIPVMLSMSGYFRRHH